MAITYFYTKFSEIEINDLFRKLKDEKSGKVEIQNFLRYFCGEEYDMIDKRMLIYKNLYKYLVKQNKLEKFLEMLE